MKARRWHLILDHQTLQLMVTPSTLASSKDVILDTFLNLAEAQAETAELKDAGVLLADPPRDRIR